MDLVLAFADFWPLFDPNSNFFVWMFERHYNVRVVHPFSHEADILIYSVFGSSNRHVGSKKRVFFTGENVRPDLDSADLSLSFDRTFDPRHVRLPLWLYYTDVFGKDPDPEHVPVSVLTARGKRFLPSQKNAIMMMASNPCGFRLELWPRVVSALGDKAVSLGSVMHTPGLPCVPVGDKLPHVRNYRLNLAIENGVHPGYTTEKILHAYAGNAIPVYYGDPTVCLDFNPRSFLDINGMSASDAVRAIADLLNDPARMESMLAEPPMERPPDLDACLAPVLAIAADVVAKK